MNEESQQKTQPIPGAYVPPAMAFEPKRLEFGAYNPNLPLLQQPSITLRIRNTGGSILIGRIIPQVSWLIIHPIQFKCAPGQISEHALQLSTGAPQNWNLNDHQHPHALVISSNAGAAALDLSYTLDLGKHAFSPANIKLTPRDHSSLHTRFLFPLALLFFSLLIILGLRNLFGGSSRAEQAALTRDPLLTQGAQTVLAEAGLADATQSPSAVLYAAGEASPTSLSVFSPLTTDTPDLTATAFQPTFTPWATDTFANPEVFVQDYFQLLSERSYNASWNMLTRRYQEECCTALGVDPYFVYSRDWGEIESVTLISAFLQEYDRNPAPVQVRYQIKKADEPAEEIMAMVWLISDATLNTLQIDVIDILGN